VAGTCLVVCGPTASGKTRLILALGEETDIVAVSADSRQIYLGFDIGTAKPTAAERACVPHACLDLAAPTTRYTAYAWAAEADNAMSAARASGRLPVVVGGAGFYVRALVHPVTPHAPTGVERLIAQYLVIDPGAPLRDRIAERADAMLGGGWLEEVADLSRRLPRDAPAWQASGYNAVLDYVDGRASIASARERIVVATRQYAKRQRTWFRHQLPPERVTRLNPDDPDAIPRALAWIRRHGLDEEGTRR
jgi:tRNA dimethylallyltransferase